jgi:hypothetical protein
MMDEAKWLSCTSWTAATERMLDVVKAAATTRKMMLLAANWVRELDTSYVGPNAKDMANSIEQVADHEIDAMESPYFLNAWFDWAVAMPLDEFGYQFATLLDTQQFAIRGQRQQAIQTFESRESRLTDYVREQFGNPFRPVTFSPVWRTSTAVALARHMYESRDFSAMPILADALQDAGCANEDILNHCHGGGPHVRGCWVIDLVLEKE